MYLFSDHDEKKKHGEINNDEASSKALFETIDSEKHDFCIFLASSGTTKKVILSLIPRVRPTKISIRACEGLRYIRRRMILGDPRLYDAFAAFFVIFTPRILIKMLHRRPTAGKKR